MLDPALVRDLAAIARQAAAAGAKVVRESARPGDYTGGTNAGGDRVLVVDLASDAEILLCLAKRAAALGLSYSTLSEESGLQHHGADYPLFIVDPLDGSAQARRRHPDCAVSIAIAAGPLLVDVVAGIVQPVMYGGPFMAIAGEGARMGDRALPLTPPPAGPATSVLLEGPDAATTARLAARFAAALPACQIHASGSIALQLALTAAGCFDMLVACRPGAQGHDIAAGWLLVREAKGFFADLEDLDLSNAGVLRGQATFRCVVARREDLLAQAIAIARTD